MRYYLEIYKDGARLVSGATRGYATLEEAQAAALASVDDALPQNTIRILAHVATACFGGDGEPYLRIEGEGLPWPT